MALAEKTDVERELKSSPIHTAIFVLYFTLVLTNMIFLHDIITQIVVTSFALCDGFHTCEIDFIDVAHTPYHFLRSQQFWKIENHPIMTNAQ